MMTLRPEELILEAQVTVEASAKLCYQCWINSKELAVHLERVLGFHVVSDEQLEVTAERVTLSPKELQDRIRFFHPYAAEIKHWLFCGPGGELYKINNTMLVQIPNCYYCTISTDDDDLETYSAVTFTPSETGENTLISWQVAVGSSNREGAFTRLASDIYQSKDGFLEDCLKDFKVYVEGKMRHQVNSASDQP